MLTFIGGARGCIGYKFAIIEYAFHPLLQVWRELIYSIFRMKALLFTLLRTFEFSLAVPIEDIEFRAVAIARPSIRGEEGAQMPFIVRVCET